MATAKKCDRCGAYYDKNTKHKLTAGPKDGIRFTIVKGYESPQVDLCDNCIRKLDIFLSGIELVGFEEE